MWEATPAAERVLWHIQHSRAGARSQKKYKLNAAPGPGLAGSGDLASEASDEPDRSALAPARKTTTATSNEPTRNA